MSNKNIHSEDNNLNMQQPHRQFGGYDSVFKICVVEYHVELLTACFEKTNKNDAFENRLSAAFMDYQQNGTNKIITKEIAHNILQNLYLIGHKDILSFS